MDDDSFASGPAIAGAVFVHQRLARRRRGIQKFCTSEVLPVRHFSVNCGGVIGSAGSFEGTCDDVNRISAQGIFSSELGVKLALLIAADRAGVGIDCQCYWHLIHAIVGTCHATGGVEALLYGEFLPGLLTQCPGGSSVGCGIAGFTECNDSNHTCVPPGIECPSVYHGVSGDPLPDNEKPVTEALGRRTGRGRARNRD